MSRIYDEYDYDRPLAKGALTRFLQVQDRIKAILESRLEAWYQAEHGTGTPYGSRLASIDWNGLYYERREDGWTHERFTVPLEILTDPDFEATCAAKVAARQKAKDDQAKAGAAARRGAAVRTARGKEARERAELARLAAKYGEPAISTSERSGAS